MDSIILEQPDKQHPVLEYEKCERMFENLQQKLDGETIGSPFDIYSVETIRKRLELEKHPSHPADVFVWGEGEPAKPYLTKIGGVPYYPREFWPHTENDDKPYIFLAQICFVDSKDVLPFPLPGDVLSIFMRHDLNGPCLVCYKPVDLYFQWVRIGDQPIWDQQAM